jgi:hypothetical protein
MNPGRISRLETIQMRLFRSFDVQRSWMNYVWTHERNEGLINFRIQNFIKEFEKWQRCLF